MDDEARLTTSQRLLKITDEFLQRLSAGELPEVEDYAERYPDLASEIRTHLRVWLRKEQSEPTISDVEALPKSKIGKLPIEGRQLPIGLGRYQLKRLVGQGNMGAVYEAYDLELERTVALKIPQLTGVTPKDVERFYREARSMATISHPNVCAVFDVAEIQEDDVDQTLKELVGRPYLTMAFVEGTVFADLVRGQWSCKDAAKITLKLASALQAVHDAGIVHRDLKPGNIIIDRHGEPIVMDFGLARRDHPDEPALTIQGQVFGSPAYMSPEQVSGKALGTQSDLYSLGVVLFELLCGRRPFNGATLEVLRDVTWLEPPEPSKVRSDIDPALEAICLKAMSKDAADRYATAADFAADLRIYLDDRMPTAVTSRIGASRLTSRHVIFACVGLVVAILCSPLMWSNWNNLRGVETPSSSALRNSDSAPILNAATLRRQFDAILQDRFKHRGYITKSPNISARYRDTFASLGIWPGEIEALEFWHFLNKADVEARAEFLIALQAWRSCTTREQEDVPVAWLNAILAAHDSRHAHIRDAVSKQNEQVGRYVDAYDAIGEDPRYAVIWSDYLRGPDSKLAIELLTKVHRAHPNSLLVETALGIRYRQDRSYQKAMERLESALAMEKSAVLWTNLAICQIRTKQFDEAICAARKAIHLDSEYGIAYHFLGRALLAEGRYAEADDAFRTAIEKDTGSPGDTHRHHAHALAKLNRAEDAHLARLRAIPYMQANRRWSVVLNFTTASLDHLAEAQPDNFDERFRLALIAQQASSKVNRVYQSRKRIQTLLQDLKAQAPTSQARIQRLEKIVQASNGKRDKKR